MCGRVKKSDPASASAKRLDGLDRPGRGPEVDEHPAPRQRAHRPFDGRSADRIVDDIHPAPVRGLPHPRGEVLPAVEDDVVRPTRGGDPRLLLGADGGEHLRPAVLRQRDEMLPDPTCRRMHQAAYPLLDPEQRMREVVGGAALQHQGRRRRRLDRVRDLHQPPCRYHRGLGVAPERKAPGDPIAGRDRVHVQPDPLDDPAAFTPERERRRVRVSVGLRIQAVAVVDVGVVDARVLQPHQRLVRAGLGRGGLAQHHVLGSAVGVDLHGFHARCSLRRSRLWRCGPRVASKLIYDHDGRWRR